MKRPYSWRKIFKNWPKYTICIISNEFCERFSYMAMRGNAMARLFLWTFSCKLYFSHPDTVFDQHPWISRQYSHCDLHVVQYCWLVNAPARIRSSRWVYWEIQARTFPRIKFMFLGQSSMFRSSIGLAKLCSRLGRLKRPITRFIRKLFKRKTLC